MNESHGPASRSPRSGGSAAAGPLAGLLAGSAWQRLRERGALVRRCRQGAADRVVHRLRVETRRLLAQLKLLAPFLGRDVLGQGRRALRRQLKALSDLRDLQVQIGLVGGLLASHPELQPLRRHLRELVPPTVRRMQRKIGRRKQARRIRRLGTELLALAARAGESDARFRARIGRLLGRVRLRLVELGEGATRDLASLHRLRVALKGCRYLLEALPPGGPAGLEARLERMRAWQAGMGEILDLALLEDRVRRFARDRPEPARYEPVRRLLSRRRARLERALRPMTAAQLRLLLAFPAGLLRHRSPANAAPQIRLTKRQSLRSRRTRLALKSGRSKNTSLNPASP